MFGLTTSSYLSGRAVCLYGMSQMNPLTGLMFGDQVRLVKIKLVEQTLK